MGLNLLNCSQETPSPSGTADPTLVEVGQSFFVQFHGGGGGCAEDVLKGWQFGIVLRRQLRLFLLEDRQRKDISAMCKLYTVSCKEFMDYPNLNLHLVPMI